jgi:membrane carboxypeptidase/penicillin-binding protein PbpC
VLGWTPKMAPIILRQPQAVTVSSGSAVSLTVQVAAISGASYQWFKNNSAIGRATDAVLKLENVKATDAGNYTVIITNDSGAVTSAAAILTVK